MSSSVSNQQQDNNNDGATLNQMDAASSPVETSATSSGDLHGTASTTTTTAETTDTTTTTTSTSSRRTSTVTHQGNAPQSTMQKQHHPAGPKEELLYNAQKQVHTRPLSTSSSISVSSENTETSISTGITLSPSDSLVSSSSFAGNLASRRSKTVRIRNPQVDDTSSDHPAAVRIRTAPPVATSQQALPHQQQPKKLLSPLKTMTPKSRAKSVYLQYTEGKTPRDLARETLRMAFTPNQTIQETSPNFSHSRLTTHGTSLGAGTTSSSNGAATTISAGDLIIPRDLSYDDSYYHDGRHGAPVVRRPKMKKNFRINSTGVALEYKKHKIYGLMKCVQMGIRAMADLIYERPKRELSSTDFKVKSKVWFPSSGTDKTPPHQFKDFEFKDFHPMAFRHVRDVFGIDHGEYISSLCGAESLSMLGTPGKSNALFFFSYNTRYILKTVTKQEAKLLTKILPHYLSHISNNPDTLLCRFYGLHRIKPVGGKTVRFIVMNNVFHTHLKIHEKYDLKGSTHGRYAKDKNNPHAVLKDLDIKKHIKIGKDKTKKILLQIAKDCRFLANHGIMDYSMLIGVHKERLAKPEESFLDWNHHHTDTDSSTPGNSRRGSQNSTFSPINMRSSLSWMEQKEPRRSVFQMDGGGCRSVDEEDDSGSASVYFFGIIDILQYYNPRKRAERFFKSLRYSSSKISVAMPHYYSLRFQEFMRKVIVDVEDEEEPSYYQSEYADPRFQLPSRSQSDAAIMKHLQEDRSYVDPSSSDITQVLRVESAPHLQQ